MTKIRVLSDLHLEFAPLALEPIGEDVLALVGDAGVYTDGAVWAVEYARRSGVPVVMVAGNHEFYRNRQHPTHTVESTLVALRAAAAGSAGLLTFLDNDLASVAGVVFVGCTLWTDFMLSDDPTLSMLRADRMMNDHRVIYDEEGQFTPERSRRLHEWSVGLLRERLPLRYLSGAPLVILTHHLPSARSIHERYAGDPLNAAYASNLDELVAASGAALWCHGHTHSSADYMIGDTRVLCNPRGYAPRDVNPAFDPGLVVGV